MKPGLKAFCLHPVLPKKCKQQWKHIENETPCTVQLTERIAVHFMHVKCAGVQHEEKTCTIVQTLNSFRKQSPVVGGLPFVSCSRSHAKLRELEQ